MTPSREPGGFRRESVVGSGPLPPVAHRRPQPWDARYLLVCHARTLSLTEGVWCFTLESLTGESLIEAEDREAGDLNRLSLLAAVRGLEAIDGQSIVSLISNNRYLIRSLDSSLPRWRENDFLWEDFGRKVAVQNADLWRRIDRTLGIHEVTATLVQTTRVSSHRDPVPSRVPSGHERAAYGPAGYPDFGQGYASANRSRAAFEPEPASPRAARPGEEPSAELLAESLAESNAMRIDAAHGEPFPAGLVPPGGGLPTSPDRLRRWLVGDETLQPPRPPRRGRYRAEDLALG